MIEMEKSHAGTTSSSQQQDGNAPRKNTLRDCTIKALRIFVAELVGVAMICFTLTAYDASAPGSLPVPAVVGVMFLWVVWVIGPISGAHVNPAVTLAMFVTRRVPPIQAIVYCLGQLLGAILGSWFGMLVRNTTELVGITTPANDINNGQALGLEILATSILVMAVLSVSDEFRTEAWSRGHVTMFPFAFGATLTLLAAVFGPSTGGSMNPARSLGPAIVQNHYTHQWIYIVGPCLGALVAVILYEMILTDGVSTGRLKAWFTDPKFDRSKDYKDKRNESNQSKL